MKLFYILFLILLTGCSVNTLGSKISEDLKVPKDDVLYSNEYTEYEYEDGEIISQKQIVSYAYKSDEIVLPFANEIIEKRTENIVTRNLGGLKRSAQSGYNFYKENGKWKQIKFATTTPEVFNQVSWIRRVLALDTGATSPGTMANDDTVGNYAWILPDRAKVSDNLRTFTIFENIGNISNYLKATNFGFSVSGTIDGILVEIEERTNFTTEIKDSEIKIIKSDGNLGSENKANDNLWDIHEPEEFYISYGASDDLWSESWADIDINNSNFGIVLSNECFNNCGNSYVDHIRITVYFTEAALALPAATGINIIMIN